MLYLYLLIAFFSLLIIYQLFLEHFTNKIIEGMDKEMFYKDIFQLAKKRVLSIANSLGFKDILPNVEFKQLK